MISNLWVFLFLPDLMGIHTWPGNANFEPDAAMAGDTIQPVIMRFGGDVLPGGAYEEAVGDSAGYAFRNFDLFQSADVSMVNLESPVTSNGNPVEKPFNFRVKPAFVAALARAGISVVNIANNHIYDFGNEGLFDTISYLDSLKILHVGAGRNYREAHNAAVLNVRGRRIGILGYYGGREAPGATQTTAGVARRYLKEIKKDVDTLRIRDSADFVIVNFHWGEELADTPDAEQQILAHRVIDAGANAIIGHHPHVLQGIERYHGGVIAYSLGNLLFGGNARKSYDTGILEIRLDGKVPTCRFIPLRVRNWRLCLLSDTEGSSIVEHVRKLSGVFRHTIFTN